MLLFFWKLISYVYRLYVGGAQYQGNSTLDGKIVLITGASGGLGLQTAKELAKRGKQIYNTTLFFH